MRKNDDEDFSLEDEYEFADFKFYPKILKIIHLKTQKEVILRRNVCEFLLLLVNSSRKTVTYEEFRDGVEAWKTHKEVSSLVRTIHVTKGELIKNLRTLASSFDLIESVPAKGYRLNTDVVTKADQPLPPQINNLVNNSFFQNLFGQHLKQTVFACAGYSSLFVIALFVEITYRYDEFKIMAFKLAFFVFLWVFVTSCAGVTIPLKLHKKKEAFFEKFILSAVVFIISAAVLFLFIDLYLPKERVTLAFFQTYTASAAYLKNILYFLPLGIFFVAFPLNAVRWLKINSGKEGEFEGSKKYQLYIYKNPILGAVYFFPKLMVCFIIIGLLASLAAMSRLFENLVADPYKDLFIKLVLLRWFVYFFLAVECAFWFWNSLNFYKNRFYKKEF